MGIASLPLKVGQASNIANAKLGGGSSQNIPTVIEQTERLFTTRSRSINHTGGGGDRGERTYIQLITSRKDNLVGSHASEHMSKPTSLGTDSKGALVDATNGKYGEFLLTDIRAGFDEKMQISEVFGDAEVVYYFGRQPLNVQFQGVLVDSPDNNWFLTWVEMYAHVFRGTELARNYELIKIITPNMTFIGSLTHMSWNQNSQRDVDIPFEFNMLVKQVIPNAVMIPGKPATTGSFINSDKAESFRTQSQIVSQKSLADKILGKIKDPGATLQDLAGTMMTSSPLGGAVSVVTSSFGNITSGMGSGASQGGSMFNNVTSNLAGMRASLFSPVYGVLNSLTKLIKAGSGAINSVVKSFTNPVRDILRDVRNVSNQAIGVVNLINNTIRSTTNQVRNVDSDLRATLATLKRTAGVISNAPQTIVSNLRDLANSGKLPASTKFLQNSNGPKLGGTSNNTTKMALLQSGPKHSPEKGARL